MGKVKDRQSYNLILTEFIEYVVRDNEDIRFFQLFISFYEPIMLESPSAFYQEPWVTLDKLEDRIRGFEETGFITKLNELKEKHLRNE